MSTVVALARPTAWNPGGGRSIQIAPTFGIAALSRDELFLTLLNFRDGYSWLNIYTTPETLSCEITESDTDNGEIWTVTAKGFYPGDSRQAAATFYQLARMKKHIVRFVDNNGLVRVAGSVSEGLELTYQLTTDEAVSGSRGYSFTLSGTLTSPPLYE